MSWLDDADKKHKAKLAIDRQKQETIKQEHEEEERVRQKHFYKNKTALLKTMKELSFKLRGKPSETNKIRNIPEGFELWCAIEGVLRIGVTKRGQFYLSGGQPAGVNSYNQIIEFRAEWSEAFESLDELKNWVVDNYDFLVNEYGYSGVQRNQVENQNESIQKIIFGFIAIFGLIMLAIFLSSIF